MTSTLIYSELLSNIRQISVLAELPTPSDSSTLVSLSQDRKCLSLLHQDKTTKLELSGDVSSAYIPQQPAAGLKQISWRIPLTPQPPQAHPEFAESPSAPWSANDLNCLGCFVCRSCSATVVTAGTIKTWQDLPSANWAEMMDFWHCHKPDVPKVEQNGVDSGLVEKGYGANASFRAQKGVGKVDLMTFLLSKDDCAVSMVRIHPVLHYSPVTPSFSIFITLATITGIKKEASPVLVTTQWPCHRYNYPKATLQELLLDLREAFLQTLSSQSMGYSKASGPLNFTISFHRCGILMGSSIRNMPLNGAH